VIWKTGIRTCTYELCITTSSSNSSTDQFGTAATLVLGYYSVDDTMSYNCSFTGVAMGATKCCTAAANKSYTTGHNTYLTVHSYNSVDGVLIDTFKVGTTEYNYFYPASIEGAVLGIVLAPFLVDLDLLYESSS